MSGSLMPIWFATVLVLMLSSMCLPGLFIVALVAFYGPILIGVLYLMFDVLGPDTIILGLLMFMLIMFVI